MSAWLDGECPPGDPTTVRQRLDDIDAWITEDKVGAAQPLLDVLNECQVQSTRVRSLQNYEVDNAAKLFNAWGTAKTAREKPPQDPGKVDEWRSAKDEMEEI